MKKTVLFLLVFPAMLFAAQTPRPPEANMAPTPQQPKQIEVPKDPNFVVMTFDGKTLTIGQIKYLTPEIDYATMENIADFWLNTQLLYEEAVKKGIDKDPKAKFLADLGSKRPIAGALIDKVQSEVKVSDADVKKYYDENKDTDPTLKEPTYLSFSHITVDTPEKAQEVLNRINKGEDINVLAKELSVEKDAQKGGRAEKYQEKTVLSRFGQDFLDALLKASEGQIIGPIKNKEGKYEIARHEGKRAARIIEFDKVKDRLKETFEGQAKKKAVDDLLNNLKGNAKGRYKKTDIQSENIPQEKEKNPEKIKN
jgi:parvulin-like peptidyl-prolyl isomerase